MIGEFQLKSLLEKYGIDLKELINIYPLPSKYMEKGTKKCI